jgi:hypothetical protein
VSILSAAKRGNRLATLIAMRNKLADDMDNASPAVAAQIAARLQSVLSDIAGLPVVGKVSKLDELEKRRKDRLAAAANPKPAKRTSSKRAGT